MTREVLPPLEPICLEDPTPEGPLHPRAVYLSLDKGFGNVPSEELFDLAMQLETSDNAHDLAYAGSALIESTIFSPYRGLDTVDNDLFTAEYGVMLLQKAAAAEWHDLERGYRHFDDQSDAIRAEVHASFAQIYYDLIAGEVTPLSREQTYQKVAYWGRYTHANMKAASAVPKKLDNEEGHDGPIEAFGFKSGHAGLAYEIATLLAGLTDDIVLIPSTPRGGSGMYNPYSTHDFNYLELDELGIIKTNTPIELKHESNAGRKLDTQARYSPFHVVVVSCKKDLSLHRNDLTKLFSQMYTPQARNFASIRAGLYTRVQNAAREYGDTYEAGPFAPN